MIVFMSLKINCSQHFFFLVKNREKTKTWGVTVLAVVSRCHFVPFFSSNDLNLRRVNSAITLTRAPLIIICMIFIFILEKIRSYYLHAFPSFIDGEGILERFSILEVLSQYRWYTRTLTLTDTNTNTNKQVPHPPI